VKIAIGVAALAVVGLFAFQNCNKVPSANAGQNPEQSVSKYSLPVDDIASVNFYISGVSTVTKAGRTFSLKYNKTLKVDPDSGEIIEANDLNSDTNIYCMPEDVRQELLNIFASSQVCKTQPQLSPDQVCTQVYKTPYCEIAVGEEITALGSASDGCGSNSVDLCDGQKTVLQDFIQKLSSSYTSYKCSE
jgi:hypothetical protein